MECSKTSKHSCLPSKSFDAGNVAEAFRYLDSQNQIGKATISFQDSTSLVRVRISLSLPGSTLKSELGRPAQV